MKKRLFSKEDLASIETEIRNFEKKTSGQIVVVTSLKSDPYTSVPLRFSLLGGAIATLKYFILARSAFWLPAPYLLLFQITAMVFFYLFGKTSFAIFYFVPKALQDIRVKKAAFAHFTAKGVHETHNHSGILIYLSETERAVEILADSGAFHCLGKDPLHKEALKIVSGIQSGQAKDALCKSIQELAILLQKHFPAKHLNKNELSDEVQVE